MEQEKKVEKASKRKRNIIIFFILMVIAMTLLDLIMAELYPALASMIIYGKYGKQVIIEGVCAILILIVLLLFKNFYIFTEKKEKFLKSLAIGGYITVFSTLMLAVSFLEVEGDIRIVDIGSLAMYCLLIGIFEEFLCRGWIQNEFIERFANNRKQILLSILLSAFIFGGMHISNIWIAGQSVIDTASQIIQATGMGFLLGAIYFRTKNIWSVVFLHGYWDFALFVSELNIIKACSQGATSLEYKISMLASSTLLALMYIIIGLYVLRKHKTKGLIENEIITEEDYKKSKRKSFIYVLGAIFVFLIAMNIPTPEVEETCYEYETKHISYNEIITPVYSEYTIEELNTRISLTENNQVLFQNLDTNKKEYFDKNYISQFVILKDNNKYKIMLLGLNDLQNDTVVYYSEFDVNNEKEFSNIIKSFKLLDDAPTTNEIKYLTSLNNKTYFIIETSNGEQMVLIDNKFYILVHQENTTIEEDNLEEIEKNKEENTNENIIQEEIIEQGV